MHFTRTSCMGYKMCKISPVSTLIVKGMEYVPNIYMSFDQYLILELFKKYLKPI